MKSVTCTGSLCRFVKKGGRAATLGLLPMQVGLYASITHGPRDYN